MTPWLSVIVPVHEGARFLEATLASAVAERPQGVEFLLYDSGDDGGAACRIAQAFADRLDIRWRATPDVGSWTKKTNLGVREARAEHMCMLHQDDLWLPGHLAAIRAALAAEPHAVMSIAPSRFVSASGKMIGNWRLPFPPGPVTSIDFVSTLLVQNSVATPSPVIRCDAWLEAGGMDENLWYTADWDVYLRIARQGNVFVRETETTAFRLHRNSLTITGSSDASAFRAQLETVLERHLPFLPAAQRYRSSQLARASIEINCALAASMGGQRRKLIDFLGTLIRLGPADFAAFLSKSRIIDRLMPRVMLRLTGAF